jgi:hypothetical protein
MRTITLSLVSFAILSLVVYQATAQEIGWEAENFNAKNGEILEVLNPPFDTTDSDGNAYTISEASGGAFVGSANGGPGNDQGSWLKYEFNVPLGGDWYFWFRVIAPTGADNSFYWFFDGADADAVSADNENTNIQDFNESGNFPFGEGNEGDRTQWAWFRLSSRTGPFEPFPGISYEDPTPLPLTAGSHTLHLIHREDGAHMDWIYATMDAGYDANQTPPDITLLGTAVELQGKITTTWGNLKRAR